MSWAFSLNNFKDDLSRLRLNNPNGSVADADSNSQNALIESLEGLSLNFGVGYYLNPRNGFELTYNERLSSGNKLRDTYFPGIGNGFSNRFFQLSFVHYFET